MFFFLTPSIIVWKVLKLLSKGDKAIFAKILLIGSMLKALFNNVSTLKEIWAADPTCYQCLW